MRSRLRIPVLRDGSGQPLRLPQIDRSELLRIHSFTRKLRERFPDALLLISGPRVRVAVPVPRDPEEFGAIVLPLADRVRVIVFLWTSKVSCYLDLCANLLAACENHLVIEGEDELVREVAGLWEISTGQTGL